MDKRVKGVFFIDYVRMMRRRPDIEWSKYLRPEDQRFLTERIEDSEWYPFEAFERMGLAIITEIAGGDFEGPYLWGRASVDGLSAIHESLVCHDDPMVSLMRFQVLRTSFFNFDPVVFESITGNRAIMKIEYGMCGIAEHAATGQTLGYFERILELSGACNVQHRYLGRIWEGDPITRLAMTWEEGSGH